MEIIGILFKLGLMAGALIVAYILYWFYQVATTDPEENVYYDDSGGGALAQCKKVLKKLISHNNCG